PATTSSQASARSAPVIEISPGQGACQRAVCGAPPGRAAARRDCSPAGRGTPNAPCGAAVPAVQRGPGGARKDAARAMARRVRRRGSQGGTMLPSAAAIPTSALAPDLAALLATVGWLAIVPAVVVLGVLLLGILTEDRAVEAARRRARPTSAPPAPQ